MPPGDELPPWWAAQLRADMQRIFRRETAPGAAEGDSPDTREERGDE